MKINGNDYQISKPASEIFLSELQTKKPDKMKKFFSLFDKEGGKADGKLSKEEIQNALNTIGEWSKLKKDDNKLTRREIRKAFKENPELKDLSKKEVREFIKLFLSLNEQKVLSEEAKAQYEETAAQEVEEVKAAKDAQETSKGVKASEKTYDYVVPEGQSFKALMKKVLLAEGKKEDELTDEDYAKAEEQFRADNPDTKIRGNKVKYLLAGEKVKVSVDFGEELLDPKAEEAKWAQKVEAKKQARAKAKAEKEDAPDPKVVEEAKSKGMRPTYNKNYFYNEEEKMHYRYKDGKFIKYANIKLFRKDGTYVREYKNADGSYRTIDYSKDGYPTTMQGRNAQGKAYLNEKKQAQVLGLKDTYAINKKHIYYDPKTKMHFKWNDAKKQFGAMNKDIRYVAPDGMLSFGTEFDPLPKTIITTKNKTTGEVKSRKEVYDGGYYAGNSYTYDNSGFIIKNEDNEGNSYEYTNDAKGNRISTVHKKNGMVQGVYNNSYDNEGGRTHTTHRDASGRVVSFGEFKYDSEGFRVNETYKDGTGKLIKTVEWHKNEDGAWVSICKDGTGKVISYEEYKAIEV